jgi:hypothetical protein
MDPLEHVFWAGYIMGIATVLLCIIGYLYWESREW